jgi:hypothetical protein
MSTIGMLSTPEWRLIEVSSLGFPNERIDIESEPRPGAKLVRHQSNEGVEVGAVSLMEGTYRIWMSLVCDPLQIPGETPSHQRLKPAHH